MEAGAVEISQLFFLRAVAAFKALFCHHRIVPYSSIASRLPGNAFGMETDLLKFLNLH